MSTANSSPSPEILYDQLLQATLRGCDIGRRAAEEVAKGVGGASSQLVETVRKHEEQLDTLDREINEGVTTAITNAPEQRARQLLACLKFIIELERIGDLLLNVSN